MQHPNRPTAVWLSSTLVLLSLLSALAAGTGCRKKEAVPVTTGGATYYTGPMVPKGKGAAGAAAPPNAPMPTAPAGR